MGRRQASLGTPVPRTPTVAPGPKARPDLAVQGGGRARAKRRGPYQPAALGAAWRLIGLEHLHFPMVPRQLHGLDKSLHAKRVMITCDRGGRRLAFSGYKYGTACALPVHPPLSSCPRRGGSRLQRRGRLAREGPALLRPSVDVVALASTPRPPPRLPAATVVALHMVGATHVDAARLV